MALVTICALMPEESQAEPGSNIHPLPQDLHRVMGKDWIMADEDGRFRIGLGNQKPIKRILVMCGELVQRQHMGKGNRQHLDMVGLLLGNDHLGEGKA